MDTTQFNINQLLAGKPDFVQDIAPDFQFFDREHIENQIDGTIKNVVLTSLQQPSYYFSSGPAPAATIYRFGTTVQVNNSINDGTPHKQSSSEVDLFTRVKNAKMGNPIPQMLKDLEAGGVFVYRGDKCHLYRKEFAVLNRNFLTNDESEARPNYSYNDKDHRTTTLVPLSKTNTRTGLMKHVPKYKVANRTPWVAGLMTRYWGRLPECIDATKLNMRGWVWQGRPQGQVNRMIICEKQFQKMSKLCPSGTDLIVDDVRFVADWDNMSIFHYPDFGRFRCLLVARQFVESGQGGYGFTVKLEPTSNCGNFFTNSVAKNGGTVTINGNVINVQNTVYATAEVVMRDCRRFFQQDPDIENLQPLILKIVAYLKKEWLTMFTFFAKAKYEFVLEMKAEEKIRTFYAASAVANAFLMFFVQPFSSIFQIQSGTGIDQTTRRIKICKAGQRQRDIYAIHDQEFLINLIGYKQLGIAQKIIDAARSLEDREYFFLVFSDNLFFCYNLSGVRVWQSWDGAKMETCHKLSDFLFYEEVFSKALTCDENIDEAFFRAVFRMCTHDPVVLLGDNRITVHGMLSGVFGTSQMNTIKMMQVCNVIHGYLQFGNDYRNVNCPVSRIPACEDPFLMMDQRPLEIIGELSKSVGVEITKERNAIIPDGQFNELDVDFLGSRFVRAYFLEGIEYYVCALEVDRISNAMVFEKTDFKHIKDSGTRLAAQRGVMVAKSTVLYEIGAWFAMDHKSNAILQTIIASYYIAMASLLTDVLDPKQIQKYIKQELEDLQDDDEIRSFIQASSMVDQSIAYQKRNIGGLYRINQLYVEPQYRQYFMAYAERVQQEQISQKGSMNTWDKIQLGWDVPDPVFVIQDLCRMEFKPTYTLEEYDHIFGDDLPTRISLAENANFAKITNKQVAEVLETPFELDSDVRFQDLSDIIQSLISGCENNRCETVSRGKDSITVFHPTIRLQDAKVSHAKAWDDHLIEMTRVYHQKKMFGVVGLPGYIMKVILGGIGQHLVQCGKNQVLLFQQIFGITIQPRKGMVTIRGAFANIQDSFMATVQMQDLKNLQAFNCFIPLAMNEVWHQPTYRAGIVEIFKKMSMDHISLEAKDTPLFQQTVSQIGMSLAKMAGLVLVQAKATYNSFIFNSNTKIVSQRTEIRKGKVEKLSVADLKASPPFRPGFGIYFMSSELVQYDKKKTLVHKGKYFNQFVSRSSQFYLLAKSIWDYAKSINEKIKFSTGDIMHNTTFKAYFKNLCSQRRFDIQTRIINAGEVWIDKSDPINVLKDLQGIQKGSLTSNDLNVANMLLSQNTGFPILMIPEIEHISTKVQTEIQTMTKPNQLYSLLSCLQSSVFSAIYGQDSQIYKPDGDVITEVPMGDQTDFRNEFQVIIQQLIQGLARATYLLDQKPKNVPEKIKQSTEYANSFQVELMNLQRFFDQISNQSTTSVIHKVLTQKLFQISTIMSQHIADNFAANGSVPITYIDNRLEVWTRNLMNRHPLRNSAYNNLLHATLSLFVMYPNMFVQALKVLEKAQVDSTYTLSSDQETYIVNMFFASILQHSDIFKDMEKDPSQPLYAKHHQTALIIQSVQGAGMVKRSQVGNSALAFYAYAPELRGPERLSEEMHDMVSFYLNSIYSNQVYFKRVEGFFALVGFGGDLFRLNSEGHRVSLAPDPKDTIIGWMNFLEQFYGNPYAIGSLRAKDITNLNYMTQDDDYYTKHKYREDISFNFQYKIPLQYTGQKGILKQVRIAKYAIVEQVGVQEEDVCIPIEINTDEMLELQSQKEIQDKTKNEVVDLGLF